MGQAFGFSHILAPNSKFPGQLRRGGNSRIIAAFIQLLPHHLVEAPVDQVGGCKLIRDQPLVLPGGGFMWPRLASKPPAACRINEYLEVNKSRDRLRKICLNFLPVLHLWLPPSPVFIWGRLSVISVSLSTPILLCPAQDSQGRFVSPQFSQKSSQLLICWRRGRGCAIYSKNDNRPTCFAICQVSLLNVSTWRPCLQKVPSNVTTAYTQCMYIAHKKYALSSTIHVPNEPMYDCMFSE